MKNIPYFLMVKLYKNFIFCLCIAIFMASDAYSFKMGKKLKGLTGGGKNPGGEIIKFLTAFPGLFESFGTALVKTKANIQTARLTLQSPVVPAEVLLKSYMLIGLEVYKLYVQSINFRVMPPVIMFKTFAFQCGSPVLTAAMAIPAAGQVVVGLCSRLSALEVKFDVLVSRIENTISEGMSIRETIQERLSQMPNGPAMLSKIPAIVFPPMPEKLLQPPAGIPGMVIPKLPSIPNPQMMGQMQNQMGDMMQGSEEDSMNLEVDTEQAPVANIEKKKKSKKGKKASTAKKDEEGGDSDSEGDSDEGEGDDSEE
ncbi:MAG: hypothetical protein C0432_00675 [Candidatus Puniceispirillum sp.]|nr:hypothetical protein [Candidatus Puniceispirillum sp.]